jgi:DNA polymerase
MAGEKWKLQAFAEGKDLYCSTASAMFKVPVVKNGVNGDLRQKGKIAELACIARDSIVLTDRGLKPIQYVTTYDRLWDGEEWVEHEGLVYRGIREVITYEGLTATPDHPVWVKGQTEPIYFGIAAALGLHLIQTGYCGQPIRLGENYQPGEKVERAQEPLLCADKLHRLWGCSMAAIRRSEKRRLKGLSELFATKKNPSMAVQEADGCKAEMRKSKKQGLQKLWRKGHKVRFSKCKRCGAISHRDLRTSKQGFRDRPNRHKQRLCCGQSEICRAYDKLYKSAQMCTDKVRAEILALCLHNDNTKTLTGYDTRRNNIRRRRSSKGETKELAFDIRKAFVYDIRNAGRHHRFTVSGHLVHNCGYGGSVGALKAFGALELGLAESELEGIVSSWRSANPNIVKLWWAVGNAAIDLIEGNARMRIISNKLKMAYQRGRLLIHLPSGRLLVYPDAAIGENQFGGECMTYSGVNSTTHQWDTIDTYGPRLVENIIQAVARDLLAEALLRISKNPDCKIIAHVHDEIIIEADPDKVTLDDMIKAMCVLPDWGDGLILNAAGFTSPYYMKD